MLAQTAAGSALEMGDTVHGSCFFLLWKVLVFAFVFYAAVRWLTIISALVPIAQMKPNSSRATAIAIFLWSLPAAASLM